jgi:hypothetical protein
MGIVEWDVGAREGFELFGRSAVLPFTCVDHSKLLARCAPRRPEDHRRELATYRRQTPNQQGWLSVSLAHHSDDHRGASAPSYDAPL